MDTVKLQLVEVMYVVADGGLAGIKAAWGALEGRLPSLRGRKFYGTFQFPDGPYRACVALTEQDSPEALDLERGMIPAGFYARKIVLNWEDDPKSIATGFDELAKHSTPDPTRPSIEFYRRHNEVILYLPIFEPTRSA